MDSELPHAPARRSATTSVPPTKHGLIAKLAELESSRDRIHSLRSDASQLLERYGARKTEQEAQRERIRKELEGLDKTVERLDKKITFNAKIGDKLAKLMLEVTEELEDLQKQLRECDDILDAADSDGDELERSFYSSLLKEGLVSQTDLPDASQMSQSLQDK